MTHLRLCCTVVLVHILLCPVLGQTSLDSLQSLDEVVVIAKPFQALIPSQSLGGKQLEALSSYSVADALRYFAGVKLKDYGGMGGLKTIDVRNMGSQHVGVFYNGIAVGNAQNGIVDLGKFSLDNVEEISMYNGQKSDVFQSAKDFSSASSIYIRTKRPGFAQGKNINLTVGYKASTIETYNPSIRLEQKLNDKLRLTLSTEFLKSPGNYKFDLRRVQEKTGIGYGTIAYRRNSDIRANRLEASLFAYPDGKSSLETNIYYYNSQRGLPGAIIRSYNGFKTSNGERLGDSDFFIQSSYTREFSDIYKFQAKGKYAFNRTHYSSMDTIRFFDGTEGWVNMLYDNIYYQQEYYASLINQLKLRSNWDLALAVDFEYTRLNASFGNKSGPNASVASEAFAYPKRYSAIAALSSSFKLKKFKLLASMQGRFVTERTTGKSNHPSQRPIYPAPNKRELTPAIFIAYKPLPEQDLNLRLFYKQIFRMPSFNDLYYAQLGYSNLKPEFTNQYNLGFTYNLPIKKSLLQLISIQADAYYMTAKDKIIAAPTGSAFRWMMTNTGKVEGYGLDIITRFHAQLSSVDMTLSGNYSYSSARDFSKTKNKDGSEAKLSSYGDQLPYTPWHTASAILNMTYKNWMLNYSFLYVGKRYNGAVNNIEANKVQPWYTHDLSLRKDWHLWRLKLATSVEANNLFNQFYEVVLNYPMPGRNFRFNISINL